MAYTGADIQVPSRALYLSRTAAIFTAVRNLPCQASPSARVGTWQRRRMSPTWRVDECAGSARCVALLTAALVSGAGCGHALPTTTKVLRTARQLAR